MALLASLYAPFPQTETSKKPRTTDHECDSWTTGMASGSDDTADLCECWQSAAELARSWDELRSARVVAAHAALQDAQQMGRLADDRLRSLR